MKGLEVISPGLMTTIQDLGRTGWTQMGVPVSGAADQFSAALANVLLGKDINSPVLECTLSGPKFKLLIDAYQRHYRQSNITGEIDRETIILIKQHYKDMLT